MGVFGRRLVSSGKELELGLPLKTTWTRGKIELVGMGGGSGEDLKGDLGD